MKLLSHRPTLGRKMKVALGVLAGLALGVAMFDWNWFRPALERYLTHTSQRTVQLADLHLSLDAALQPTVRLRGIRIQNAPWADPRPFAVVGEARFTFGWTSLFDDVRVISHLALVDADIDLERQADGLRNWRLTRPDDRGPARVRVLSLETHNSQLRLVHRGVGLALQATATQLPSPDGPPGPPGLFTQRIVFSGRLHDAPFAGEALTGPVLTLQRTGEFFALRGQVQSGTARLQLDGRIADLLQLAEIDAHVQLSGPSLDQLAPFFPAVPWPPSRPYRAEAQLTKHGDDMAAQALQLQLGNTDLAGEIGYDKKDDLASLHATLRSERVSIADLASLTKAASGPPAQAGLRVLPQAALPLEHLHGIDAKLSLNVKTLQSPGLPDVHGLSASATLKRGLLQLSLQDAELAAGHLNGLLALDSRRPTPTVRIELRARGLRLEKLWPGQAHVEGPLNGQAQLSGRGHSVAAWAGSASGQLSLAMQGGSLSKRLDAKLGLNGGKLLRSLFSERQVPIGCGALAIDFDDGQGRTRQMVLETAQTRVEGQGSLHLRDESWAVLLTPQARTPAPLALNASVLAKGSFRDFSYTLDRSKRASTAESGACSMACAAATSSGCG